MLIEIRFIITGESIILIHTDSLVIGESHNSLRRNTLFPKKGLRSLPKFLNKTEFTRATAAKKLLQVALCLWTTWKIMRTSTNNISCKARILKCRLRVHAATRFLTKTFSKITSARAIEERNSSAGNAKKASLTANRWECEFLSFKIKADTNKKISGTS